MKAKQVVITHLEVINKALWVRQQLWGAEETNCRKWAEYNSSNDTVQFPSIKSFRARFKKALPHEVIRIKTDDTKGNAIVPTRSIYLYDDYVGYVTQ